MELLGKGGIKSQNPSAPCCNEPQVAKAGVKTLPRKPEAKRIIQQVLLMLMPSIERSTELLTAGGSDLAVL